MTRCEVVPAASVKVVVGTPPPLRSSSNPVSFELLSVQLTVALLEEAATAESALGAAGTIELTAIERTTLVEPAVLVPVIVLPAATCGVVGVPEITPVEVSRVIPAGSEAPVSA